MSTQNDARTPLRIVPPPLTDPATAADVAVIAPLPAATVGVPYAVALTASGGTPPYTWAVTSGSLPPGLALDAATGVISGTPATAGAFGFTVTVTDSTGATASADFGLAVSAAPLAITTVSLPPAVVGQAYATTLMATGGTPPYTWSLSGGSLPPGLALNASTGTISGTPTAAGTFAFIVTVSDSTGVAASASLSLTVAAAPAPLTITTTALPDGFVGTAYAASLQASGGVPPYTWSIPAESLPPGITLNAATGSLAGTPTTPGLYEFNVTVTDSVGDTASAVLGLTVLSTLAIVTTSLPPAELDVPYTATVVAEGGITPYTWALTGGLLPPGLAFQPASATIAGTPTAAGTYTFTVTVTDSAGSSASASFTLIVATPVAITTSSLSPGEVGLAYSATLAASGGVPPYTWAVTAGNLPTGLGLNPATGTISGTPATSGSFSFTVQVTDSAGGAASATFSVLIQPALIILTTSLPDGEVGVAYSQTLAAAGGSPPYTWSVSAGSLPAGLSLNPATGTISGTPTAAGTAGFTVTVGDSLGGTSSASLAISVVPAVAITTTSLPDGTVATPYSATLTASGGLTPYTWSIVSGSLPAGLTLNASTGVISGTPLSVGTSSFTVGVTDSLGGTATRALTITIA
jgi:hypothetical protein